MLLTARDFLLQNPPDVVIGSVQMTRGSVNLRESHNLYAILEVT